jgi:hypothetical protein
MGILTNIFGKSKRLPFKKTIQFERKNSEFGINVGDELNIWNKPNTKEVNLYAKGFVGGNGLVGTTSNSTISFHLNKTENLFVENKVVGLTKNTIDLHINMYCDKNAAEENQKNHKSEWIEKLNKKYNPKTSWELRFYSENKIEEKDFLIKMIDKNQLEDFYQKDTETIWLTKKNGERIIAENSIRSGGTEKTLRASFSGHELKVIDFKKENNWYYIEIEVTK